LFWALNAVRPFYIVNIITNNERVVTKVVSKSLNTRTRIYIILYIIVTSFIWRTRTKIRARDPDIVSHTQTGDDGGVTIYYIINAYYKYIILYGFPLAMTSSVTVAATAWHTIVPAETKGQTRLSSPVARKSACSIYMYISVLCMCYAFVDISHNRYVPSP